MSAYWLGLTGRVAEWAVTISSAQTLVDTLGYFRGEHQDMKDNSAYFTHKVAISDFPEGNDPGFFILFPGVFISLENFASVDFCRLRMHGGTAHTSPTRENLVEWADRVVIVSYSPNGQTQGNQCYALGRMPDNSTFFIPSEMTC